MKAFAQENGRLTLLEVAPGLGQAPTWIDLLEPTIEEERQIKQMIGVEIPDLEEMEEIEISSRLYMEGGAAFMTALLPAFGDNDEPQIAPVTFVLAGKTLVTIRHHEPRTFTVLEQRGTRGLVSAVDGDDIFLQLLEAIADRLADILERSGSEIDALSRKVFGKSNLTDAGVTDFGEILAELGRHGNIISGIRDCLVSLERLCTFATTHFLQRRSRKDIRERIKTVSRDLRSLSDHDGFLSQKINFLLDATLGMINIEQNGIIKIFSVAAVVFLPPTLVASIYGMNFEFMPELHWAYGYPFALGLMVISVLVPFFYFKRKGWL